MSGFLDSSARPDTLSIRSPKVISISFSHLFRFSDNEVINASMVMVVIIGHV